MRRLECVMVTGYDLDLNIIGRIKARVKEDGKWITPRNARKKLEAEGAIYVKRKNMWA